jgi:L-arabinokinase
MLNDIRSQLASPYISKYEDMITQCALDYNCAHAYIQLPGHTPLPPDFDTTKLRRGPLISRLPRRSRAEVRQELSIPQHVNVLLLCFGGGHNHTFHLREEYLPAGWVCIVLDGPDRASSKQLSGLPADRFFTVATDYYIPDLINASDCVLGKIGYGFVSECLTCDTPLVYISRSHWAEEGYLLDYLEANNMGVRMLLSDFDAGEWSKYLADAETLRAKQTLLCDSSSSEEEGQRGRRSNANAASEICALVRQVII